MRLGLTLRRRPRRPCGRTSRFPVPGRRPGPDVQVASNVKIDAILAVVGNVPQLDDFASRSQQRARIERQVETGRGSGASTQGSIPVMQRKRNRRVRSVPGIIRRDVLHGLSCACLTACGWMLGLVAIIGIVNLRAAIAGDARSGCKCARACVGAPMPCCPDDYCGKPLPCVPCWTGCCCPDDYCRKPLPNPCLPLACCCPDDYCRKPLPKLSCHPLPACYRCGDSPSGTCGRAK